MLARGQTPAQETQARADAGTLQRVKEITEIVSPDPIDLFVLFIIFFCLFFSFFLFVFVQIYLIIFRTMKCLERRSGAQWIRR